MNHGMITKSNFVTIQNEVIDDVKHFDKFEKWVWVVLARTGFAGAAFPSQKTIAEKVGISDRKVRECLASLEKKGWLVRVGKHEGYGTVMWLVTIPDEIKIEWLQNALENEKGKLQNDPEPKPEREEEIFTDPKSEKDDIPYKQIIDHLNSRTGKNFQHAGAAAQKGIRGRFAKGFTLENFIHVIDVKTEEWLGTDYEKYLNPTTLFRPDNFEKYANQPMKRQKKSGPQFAAPKQTGQAMTEEERQALLADILN